MNQEIIRFENVSKSFKVPHERKNTLKEHFLNIFKKNNSENFYVLQDINFSVAQGECLGIIGRNGSGKSTILRTISKIYEPSKGKIEVQGKISPFIELGVGFQYDLSGKDNVYLYSAILGLNRKQVNQRYNQMIQFAELENFMDQKLKNYSTGMQTRLAFSVISHIDADILLIDEVLSVGDANFQQKCLDKINDFKKKNKTIVFVSHNLEHIKKICDRVIWLDKGKVVFSGKPESSIEAYLKI